MTLAASTAPERQRGNGFGWVLVVGTFLIGFAQGPMATVGWGFTHLPGDAVDGRFNNYVLEHGYRWLRGETPSGFWHLPIYYPAPRVTAYSDAHLGSLPFYAAMRVGGLSPERAYQVWFLLPFAFNYIAAAWSARRLGGGWVAAATCGFVYAFAVTALQHTTNHSQLGLRFLVPPAVVVAHAWLLRPTVRQLMLLAGMLVLQAYLTIYIAYYLGLLLVATWVATGWLNRRSVPWRTLVVGWWKWLLVGVGMAAMLVPLVRPYLLAANDHISTERMALKLLTPAPWSWLLAPDLAWHSVWMHSLFPPPKIHFGLSELHLFPGLLPLIGLPAAVMLVARRSDSSLVLAAGGLLLAVVCTRIGGVCLYDPVFDLPGGGSIRVLARVVLVLLFPAGLALGFLLEELARERWTVGLLLVGLVVADQAVILPGGLRGEVWQSQRLPVAGVNDATDRLVELVRRERPDAQLLYVFPLPTDGYELPAAGAPQLQVAWAALRLGIPTVNGYSGYYPHRWTLFRDYDELFEWLPPEQRAGLVVVGVPHGERIDSPTNRAARANNPPLPRFDH